MKWHRLKECQPVNPLSDYLVSWVMLTGTYSPSIKAYWLEEEGSFFCTSSLFPLKVDVWAEIPPIRIE